jgi:hypothetical protein
MLSMVGLAGLLAIAQHVPAPGTMQHPDLVATATVGRGSTWDDEGSIGSGLSAGGTVEWRFRPRWSAAFRLERLGHERHVAQDLIVFDGRTLFATGEIKYRFRSAGITPYVLGGYGASLYSGTLTDRVGPPVTRTRSSRSGVAVGGGGMEIPIGDRLVVMPELRLLMCQPNDDFAPWAAIRGGVSVGWRF